MRQRSENNVCFRCSVLHTFVICKNYAHIYETVCVCVFLFSRLLFKQTNKPIFILYAYIKKSIEHLGIMCICWSINVSLSLFIYHFECILTPQNQCSHIPNASVNFKCQYTCTGSWIHCFRFVIFDKEFYIITLRNTNGTRTPVICMIANIEYNMHYV